MGLFKREKRMTQKELNNFFNGVETPINYLSTPQAMTNSNVFACINILSNDIAKLPLHTFREFTNGSKKKEKTHPVAYLLGTRPNPHMSSFVWRKLMETMLDLWGNAYSIIEWGEDGRPKALWPLDSSKVTIKFDDNSELWYVVQMGLETKKYREADMIHLKGLTVDGINGISPITAIRLQITSQQSKEIFENTFYSNGTTTNGVLEVDGEVDAEAKAIMRDEWMKLNSGLSNANKLAILDMGMKYKPLNMPLRDAEFIESKKFGILEVAKIYGVPAHKLNQLDRATFSNIEHLSLSYYKDTLLPKARLWEEELTYKLFVGRDRGKYFTKYNFDAELRADSKTRAEANEINLRNGIVTINEARDLEDRDGYGAIGDRPLATLNYTFLDMLEAYQKGKSGGDNNGQGTTNTNDPN